MPENLSKEIEKIFRVSNSTDELFDAFRTAISNKIEDPDLYKTLLWNKVLSADEIAMYAEKITEVFPAFSYNIFLWSGQIFSAVSSFGEYYDRAVKYLKKASDINKTTSEPYLLMAGLYNKELNVPPFNDLIKILDEGIEKTREKSRLCFIVSDLFKNTGKIDKYREYRRKGENFQKDNS